MFKLIIVILILRFIIKMFSHDETDDKTKKEKNDSFLLGYFFRDFF